MTSPTTPTRSPALRIVDLVAGGLLVLCALFLGLGILASYAGYGDLAKGCGCDSAPLTVWTNIGLAITVLAFALGLGFFLTRAVQRRWAFYFPLIALVVMYVGFFGITAAIGAWATSVGVNN